MAPEGRFSGLLFGAKLLADIVRVPFISSDISAGFISRLAFGARIGLF